MKNNRHSDIQFKSPQEIKAYQEARLAEELVYLDLHSKFYHQMFQKEKIDIAKIKTIEDLRHLPVTTKTDLQLHNEEFICVNREEIIDYVTTSGTLGDPVTVALTESDLDRLAYNEYLSFTTTGCTNRDIMQLMVTLDRRFMAGLAYYMGARELGAGVVRVGNGIPELQWDTIHRIQPTFCMAIPFFLTKLVEYAETHNIDYKNCSIKKAICIGESLRNPDFTLNTMGRRIHEKWPELLLLSTFGERRLHFGRSVCR